jgi:hypothetical protein
MVTLSQQLKAIGQSVGQKIASVVPFSSQITSAGQALYSVTKYIPPVYLAKEKPAVALGLAAAGAGIAVVGVPAAIAGAKAIIPKTAKGKVIGGLTTLGLYGAFTREPVAFSKAVIEGPSEIIQFGGDIAGLITDPSLESLKQLVTESPWLVGGTAALAALLATKGLSPAMILLAMKAQGNGKDKPVTPDIPPTPNGGSVPTAPPSLPPTPLTPTGPTVPVTPPTQTVTAGATTRRKYKRRVISLPSSRISQRVNVLVSNRNAATTKRYIRRNIIAY